MMKLYMCVLFMSMRQRAASCSGETQTDRSSGLICTPVMSDQFLFHNMKNQTGLPETHKITPTSELHITWWQGCHDFNLTARPTKTHFIIISSRCTI